MPTWLKILIAITVLATGTYLVATLERRRSTKTVMDVSYLGNDKDENGLPLPRGFRNNNVGNIIKSDTAWVGKIPHYANTDGKFEQFDTLNNGIRAMILLLKNYINKKGKNTIRLIVQTYAPSEADNNPTDAYIRYVSQKAGISADAKINDSYLYMYPIVVAMVAFENADRKITKAQFDAAWESANA